ncbi:uncharacterized protein K02A2.6-like [Ochlerotatus camptorhynchus]|uniref:uncharacterized protein K02A2.6-like n=1 Tax=Ochlerotatus camptorhynchus TaxID=644619 RepID=UPI0031E44C32
MAGQIYWKYKHELSTHNGLVLRNDRILIPRCLRGQMLERLHQSHSGIEATTKLARDTVFWPGLSDQIRQRIQHCDVCAKFSSNQRVQPMQSHQIPTYLYQKVSMDIYELTTQTSAAVIKVCKRNFARFGKPQEVSSDGGPQFMSEEFNMFCQYWGVKHSVSAPYHQQGNGKAESAVKITKSLMKKARESNQDFWELLLQWRNKPNKTGSSPVQRLFNRRTRFGVPMYQGKYLPKIEENVREKITLQRQQAKAYYDRKARSLPELEIGQPVFVKMKPTDTEWKNGTVINPVTDRTTVVAIGDLEYRRDNTMIKTRFAQRQDSLDAVPVKAEPNVDLQEVSSSVGRNPAAVTASPTIPESTRPRRFVQMPKKFQDYNMF